MSGFIPDRATARLLVAALRRWWQVRTASTDLADADASLLRDLGIAHSQIESVVRYGRR
jgi:uncharacterized protein YjiS (DUF1127 family)